MGASPGLVWSFVVLALVVAAALPAALYTAGRRLGRAQSAAARDAATAAVLVAVWLAATSLAASSGLLRFDTLPPTMALLFIAIIAIAILVTRSDAGARLARGLPLAVLVGFQAFRIGVELLLHRAYAEGLMPVQMSYEGLNYDIVSGVTALVLGLLLWRRGAPLGVVRVWNWLALLLLVNIVTVAWLSSPVPFRVFVNEPSNEWVTRAPWVWLPAVFVLAAFLGHLLLFRRLRMERADDGDRARSAARNPASAAAAIGVLWLAAAAEPAAAQDLSAHAQNRSTVAAVDLYGRFGVSDSAVRAALAVRPGDPVPDSVTQAEAARRVDALPGITAVQIAPVCCDGGTLVYVGVEDTSAPALRFRAPPRGAVRLPDEVLAAGAAFDTAFRAAIAAADVAEDDSLGHSLMHFPAARQAQLRFPALADRHGSELRAVLLGSADAQHRALAAQVLAYSSDKQAVVSPLVEAIADPDDAVRNNAMRALALIAALAQRRPDLRISVPYAPFVELLRSPVWTDRNKAAFALLSLTEARDAALLETLAREAKPELVQMARWHSMGHALPALIVLGRISGMDDGEVFAAVESGDRERVIRAAAGDRRDPAVAR